MADTTPLHYLVLIDEIALLPALFAGVYIPAAVFSELSHSRAPKRVQEWISRPPNWLHVHPVRRPVNIALAGLDAGEREAIDLAVAMGIKTILMDESAGRREAVRSNLKVRGTIGILGLGADKGLTNVKRALAGLDATNFRMSANMREALLKRTH